MNMGKSRLQVAADGATTLNGVPVGSVDVWEDPEPPFDWLAALGLPKDWDALDRLAAVHGRSDRFVRFILADESPTRFPGAPCMNPRAYRLPRHPICLTLSHLGYNVGELLTIGPGNPQEVPTAEGFCLVGLGRLFDSALADAAWQGILRGIFGHVCTSLRRQEQDPFGTGEILEIAITDRPGCPGARILKAWEYTDERDIPLNLSTHL